MNRVLVLSVVAIFSATACASAPKKVTLPTEDTLGTATPDETKEAPARAEASDATSDDLTRPVLFAYDSSEIDSMYSSQLQGLAQDLRSRNGQLLIEGHTDERGGTEYNLALGERRAQSAKRHLTRLGVADASINTISYGEERPAALGDTESVHSKNRRAEFVLSN